eukprot:3377105-Pleurochrysis_carterae.AAC.4
MKRTLRWHMAEGNNGTIGVVERGRVGLVVLNSFGDVEVAVEEHKGHVELIERLACHAGLIEGLVGGQLVQVAQERDGERLFALGGGAVVGDDHGGRQVCDPEQLVKLLALLGARLLKPRDDAVEHRAQRQQRSAPALRAAGEQLLRHAPVHIEVGGGHRGAVLGEDGGGASKVGLADAVCAVQRGVLDEHLRPLLLRQLQAALPVALLRVSLDALGDVALLHKHGRLATLDHVALVLLLHLLEVLRRRGARERLGLVPHAAGDVDVDGLAVRVDALVHLGRLRVPVDVDEAARDGGDNLGDALGHVVHRQLDRVLPHLLEEVGVLGAVRELARVLERPAGGDEHVVALDAALAVDVGLVLRHELVDAVRQELARDADGVVPAKRVLVHLDGELGLLGADVERFGLGELGP